MEFWGSIRINNSNTLQRWIGKGWYKREIERGYTFSSACGRFTVGKCECAKCRKVNSGTEIKRVLQLNNL